MFGCLLFMMRMKKIACLLAPTLQNRFLQKKQLISNLVNHMIFIQCNTVSQMVTLPDSIMIEHPPSTSVIFPPQIEEIPHLWARPTASFTCRRVWRGKKEWYHCRFLWWYDYHCQTGQTGEFDSYISIVISILSRYL